MPLNAPYLLQIDGGSTLHSHQLSPKDASQNPIRSQVFETTCEMWAAIYSFPLC